MLSARNRSEDADYHIMDFIYRHHKWTSPFPVERFLCDVQSSLQSPEDILSRGFRQGWLEVAGEKIIRITEAGREHEAGYWVKH